MLVRRTKRVDVECVARGYISGSAWSEYQKSGTACGIPLPAGLVESQQLAEPIFTPTTKAPLGQHDEGLDFPAVEAMLGKQLSGQVLDLTLAVYVKAEEIARTCGILLADTKIEFGRRPDGTLILADEVLTPDSSRFWDAATWEPGRRLESYDKQFVRNWLLQESGWDRASGEAPPSLPPDIVAATRLRYIEAYERLTGSRFIP